jgi:hypothetical protein
MCDVERSRTAGHANVSATTVPDPATLALLGRAFANPGLTRRRKQH